jgi:formate dehydrogenase subunit gamma
MLERFDRTERVVHRANAVLFGVLIVTGAVLYLGELSSVVGRREFVRNLHVAAGLALPVPLLLALLGRWGAALRRDLSALNRFDSDDWRWLWSRGRDRSVRLGKFNPGQKLNAAFLGGAAAVMLASGAVMRFFEPFPLAWRTGATFVHDWTALGLGLAVIGHVWLAWSDPEALQAMRTGRVTAAWARTKRPGWYEEITAPAGPARTGGSPPPGP